MAELLNNLDRYLSDNLDNMEIDFVYADADTHMNEIAELYAYSEEDEFIGNKQRFQEHMEDLGLPLCWSDMTEKQRNRVLDDLVNAAELSDMDRRRNAIRCTLYLLQGVFGECQQIEDQPRWTRQIAFLLLQKDMFNLYVQLLAIEIDEATIAQRTRSPKSLHDSLEIRMILNVLYIFVEVMLRENDEDTEQQKRIRVEFCEELGQPNLNTDELLAITLFQMITRFSNGQAPHFPCKKILLLLWKILLASLGGIDKLREMKNELRANAGLKPVPDDTLEVVKTMRPMSPTHILYDVLMKKTYTKDGVVEKRSRQLFKRQMSVNKFEKDSEKDDGFEDAPNGEGGDNGDSGDLDGLSKVIDGNDDDGKAIADEEKEDDEGDSCSNMDNESISSEIEDYFENRPKSAEDERAVATDREMCDTPRPGSPQLKQKETVEDAIDSVPLPHFSKALPWAPKVRQEDIDAFLDQARQKFFGFTLPGDRTTVAGLPEPIIESIKILNQHVYISLSELQIRREEDFANYPHTTKEVNEHMLSSSTERLYQAMLPNAPQYMIVLLKLLFAAAPTAKTKTDVMNVVLEMMPEDRPVSVLDNLKLAIDVNRHKEIIVKAASSIILLLLKHFKLNHIYQFEYLSQQLLFANVVPLILKYFNTNIGSYITSRNTISVIDFPACVIGQQTELTDEILEMGCLDMPYCWRNLYSCINLMRIMVKLNKWKPLRITSLIVLKSHNILRKSLRVKQATLQLYVLKMFKIQMRYLGRAWRKINMKMMGGIYQKVRHRFTDDWASCNPTESNKYALNHQLEEYTLQSHITRFHRRRYPDKVGKQGPPSLFVCGMPGDFAAGADASSWEMFNLSEGDLTDLFGKETELSESFKRNYEKWMQKEVFERTIDWDRLSDTAEVSCVL